MEAPKEADVRVLRNWHEVGEAVQFLRRGSLPLHPTPEKNWDLALVGEAARNLPKDAKIIDLGSAGLFALRLLSSLGFRTLVGVDLFVSRSDRMRQLKDTLGHRPVRLPYRLRPRDLTRAEGLPRGPYDLVLCLSVIEHGVEPARFFASARDLLKPGGTLLITTDYWSSKVDTSGAPRVFDLDWKIFSEPEARSLIEAAKAAGLTIENSSIPACVDRVVAWNGLEYTFLSLRFRRPPD